MTGCSLCSGTIEHFHGEKKDQHITLSQSLYIFANRNKQTISLCTMIIAVILILKNKK